MGRRLPDAAPGIPDPWRWPLTRKMDRPVVVISSRAHPPSWRW